MRKLALILAFLLAFAIPVAPAQAEDGCTTAPDAAGVYSFPADCAGEVPGGFGTPADTFRFQVPERARLVFHVTNGATGWGQTLLVDLIDPQGNVHGGPTLGAGGTGRAGAVTEGAGIWTIVLDGFSMDEVTMPYTFQARLEPAPDPVPPQDDCGSGGDAPSIWTSMRITLPVTCAGELRHTTDPDGYGNDAGDRYEFDFDAGDTATFSLTLREGVRACIYLRASSPWGETKSECRRVPAGNATETFDLALGMDEPGRGSIIVSRIAPLNTTYVFVAQLLGPTWHEQVEGMHIELGGPQFWNGLVGPSRTVLMGAASVPEGYFVEWVRLDRPVQPRGEIDIKFSSPHPASVRAFVANEDGDRLLSCGGADENGTIRCDRTTDDSWDRMAWVTTAQWVAVLVEQGIDVDASMSYRHWTRG